MVLALSSDSHVMEPPDLWTGALGAGDGDLAALAPRVEPGDDADWWVIGGQRMFFPATSRWLTSTSSPARTSYETTCSTE